MQKLPGREQKYTDVTTCASKLNVNKNCIRWLNRSGIFSTQCPCQWLYDLYVLLNLTFNEATKMLFLFLFLGGCYYRASALTSSVVSPIPVRLEIPLSSVESFARLSSDSTRKTGAQFTKYLTTVLR